MLDELDALFALADYGTMTRAANRLRVTQSAISKRVAALSERVGTSLIEPDGRRVRLTPAGLALSVRTRPLVSELREAVAAPAAESGERISLGVSESILASWGPRILARVSAKVTDVDLEFAAYRSLVAIERVRAGEYHLALCAGASHGTGDLSERPLADEPMVLVGAEVPRLRRGRTLDVITIEQGSASWRSMAPQLHKLRRDGYELRVARTVQGFAAVVQLARAGFGVGLAPLGIASALGAKRARLPGPGMSRPISVFARGRTLARAGVGRWLEALSSEVETKLLSTWTRQ